MKLCGGSLSCLVNMSSWGRMASGRQGLVCALEMLTPVFEKQTGFLDAGQSSVLLESGALIQSMAADWLTPAFYGASRRHSEKPSKAKHKIPKTLALENRVVSKGLWKAVRCSCLSLDPSSVSKHPQLSTSLFHMREKRTERAILDIKCSVPALR